MIGAEMLIGGRRRGCRGGPVAEVTALTSTIDTERPVLPMGSATHFAVTGGERRNCSVDDALSAAEVVAAAERSAADGTWHKIPPVPGAGLGREPASAPGSGHG